MLGVFYRAKTNYLASISKRLKDSFIKRGKSCRKRILIRGLLDKLIVLRREKDCFGKVIYKKNKKSQISKIKATRLALEYLA